MSNESGEPKKKSVQSPSATKQPSEEIPVPGALTAESAQALAASAQAMTEEAFSTMVAPADFSALAVEPTPSEITDELERGGPAFGSFAKSVGIAVADAQKALDQSLVATAKALSDTQIEVIAVFEQQLKDDDGTMAQGNVILQKLPLINYLMPTAYQWTRVYLEADMKVSEFSAANGFNIKQSSLSFGASVQAKYGMTGFSGSGGASFGYSTTSVSGESSYAQDVAAGTLHMEATLEPRPDMQLPRPFILQKGPRLKLSLVSKSDILDASSPPKVIGRQLVIAAELRKSNNDPHSGKSLELSISLPELDFTSSAPLTDTSGKITYTIKRQGGAFDPNVPPSPAVVRIWFGLVSESIGINL